MATAGVYLHDAEEHFISHDAAFVPLEQLLVWLQDLHNLFSRVVSTKSSDEFRC